MAPPIKVATSPQATTLERDSLPIVPNGTYIYNSTTSKIEYTLDSGTTWLEFASTSDISNVTSQSAYNNGDGSVTTVIGKPFVIKGIEGLDVNSIDVEDLTLKKDNIIFNSINIGTAINGSDIYSQDFYGKDDSGTSVLYAKNVLTTTDTLQFDQTGTMTLRASWTDTMLDFISYGGNDKKVTIHESLNYPVPGVLSDHLVGTDVNRDLTSVNLSGDVTSLGLVTTVDFSSVTLQKVYTNGDGSINLTPSKPIEVVSVSEGPQILFNRNQIGADGRVTTSIKSSGQTSTGASVSSVTLEKRIATALDASYSEYVSSSAYTNGSLNQWFLYDGRTDKFQMKSALVDYHNDTFPVVAGTLKEITISGRSSNLNIDTNYFNHTYIAQVVTNGIESGKYVINGISGGVLIPYIEIDGNLNQVKIPNGNLNIPSSLNYDGLVTSVATIAGDTKKFTANGAISLGSVVKASNVAGRCEIYLSTDIDSTGIIGMAATSSAIAGDVIELYNFEPIPVILNNTTSAGDLLEPSGAVNGRVISTTPGTGVFAVALESGVAGGTVLAANIMNEVF